MSGWNRGVEDERRLHRCVHRSGPRKSAHVSIPQVAVQIWASGRMFQVFFTADCHAGVQLAQDPLQGGYLYMPKLKRTEHRIRLTTRTIVTSFPPKCTIRYCQMTKNHNRKKRAGWVTDNGTKNISFTPIQHMVVCTSQHRHQTPVSARSSVRPCTKTPRAMSSLYLLIRAILLGPTDHKRLG
jgi:hypothetical protein